MQPSVFRFIWHYSKREQALLLLLTIIAFPFLYLSLDLPKIIINEAIGGSDFPMSLLGFELDQIPYLLTLCGVFLVLVFTTIGSRLGTWVGGAEIVSNLF